MSDETTIMIIPRDDPRAIELVLAVRSGAIDTIQRLLSENPGLAKARFVAKDGGSGTSLHLVTDWPGYFPNGPELVRLLVAAGADPNAHTTGRGSDPTAVTIAPFSETPLHWAASSDDVDIAAVLIDEGADIEARGGSIGSIAGTPLTNAVGYGCWHVARLLVTRGARVSSLWEAAALGDRPRVDELRSSDPPPSHDEINEAFWQACHGGQRRMAEHLLTLGADINATPDYSDSTPLQIAEHPDTRRGALATWLREQGADART